MNTKKVSFKIDDRVKKYSLLIIIAALMVVFTILNKIFIDPANLLNIVRQSSVMIIFAVGMTFVIISGNIDVSIVSVGTMTSMVAAMLMQSGAPIVLALLAAFGVGALFGLVNGLLVTKFNLNPMIVTLATMSAGSGGALLLNGGTAVYELPADFMFLGRGYVGFLPVQVLIMFVVVAVAALVLSKTVFGRRVYAIGGSPVVAKLAGIAVKRNQVIYFVVCSLCATLAGLILTARMATAQPTSSSTTMMDVIAAVVIGGTALSGGKGGVIGSVFGALLLTIISNGLTINSVSSYWQMVISAIILVITIIIYRNED